MMFPNKKIVDRIKKEYPSGTRVKLLHMADPYRTMQPGMKGTVSCVDDTGTIHVNWDEGGNLGVVYGEDSCEKLQTVKVICYGQEQIFDSRDEAYVFFQRASIGSEGSEHDRYEIILTKLLLGLDVCSDEVE